MDYNIPKNLMFSAITKLSNGFMLVLMIIAGRVFGDSGYGELSIVIAFVFLFENLTDLGLSEVTLRDISRNDEKANKYIGNIITWKGILCCVVFLIIYFSSQFLPYSRNVINCIYIFALSAFFKSFKYCFLAFLKAYNRYGLEAISVTFERFIILFLGIIVLTFSPSLIHLIWIFFIVRLLDLMVVLYLMNKSILKITFMFDFKFIKTLQLNALPLGIYIYIAFLYGYVDTIMLSFMKSSVEVGWYNAAYRIYDGLIILPFIIYNVMIPPLSKYFIENKDKHMMFSSETTQYSLIIAFALSFILFQQAGLIIHSLFGNSFEQAVPPFKILMVGLFFTNIIVIFNCILVSMDRLKPILYLAGFGLIVNVISNLIFIPKIGHVGAALSTAFSEFLVFTITLMYLEKICEKLKLIINFIRLSFVATIVVLMFLLCNKLGISEAILIGLCSITYLICVILFKLADFKRIGFILKMVISSKG